MKTVLMLICIMLTTLAMISQVPQGFNYQAVARDDRGQILDNQPVTVRLSIFSNVSLDSLLYEEEHQVSTNQHGLLGLVLGNGEPHNGVFVDIDWSAGKYVLKTGIDVGEGLVELEAVPLQSVPYSLYSKKAAKADSMFVGDLMDVETSGLESGQLLRWDGQKLRPEPTIYIDLKGRLGIGTQPSTHLLQVHAKEKTNFSYSSFTHYTNEESGTHPLNGLRVGLLNDQARIENGGSGRMVIATGTKGEGSLEFGSGGTWPRMTLDGAGNLGIGTQLPAAKLQVTGDVIISKSRNITNILKHELQVVHQSSAFGGRTAGLKIENIGNNNNWWSFYTTNSSGELELYYKGNLRGEFDPTDGEYRQRSDQRLKYSIKQLPAVLPKVLQLQPSSYYFKDVKNPAARSLGFIAQQIQPLFPELVGYAGENEDLMTLNYSGFAVLAIKAIQEQQQLIDQLVERIENLEKNPHP